MGKGPDMCRSVVFIEDIPEVTLDASGAKLSYKSGGEHYCRRYPRHIWRRFLEREIIRLHDWEIANRGNVVDLRRADH